jgi:hypothetical protein
VHFPLEWSSLAWPAGQIRIEHPGVTRASLSPILTDPGGSPHVCSHITNSPATRAASAASFLVGGAVREAGVGHGEIGEAKGGGVP